MMEIKTCEQYVVAKLEEAEGTIFQLRDKLEMAAMNIQDLQDENAQIRKLLKELSTVKETDDGFKYIAIETVWEKYDVEQYKQLCKILGIKNS